MYTRTNWRTWLNLLKNNIPCSRYKKYIHTHTHAFVARLTAFGCSKSTAFRLVFIRQLGVCFCDKVTLRVLRSWSRSFMRAACQWTLVSACEYVCVCNGNNWSISAWVYWHRFVGKLAFNALRIWLSPQRPNACVHSHTHTGALAFRYKHVNSCTSLTLWFYGKSELLVAFWVVRNFISSSGAY